MQNKVTKIVATSKQGGEIEFMFLRPNTRLARRYIPKVDQFIYIEDLLNRDDVTLSISFMTQSSIRVVADVRPLAGRLLSEE